MSTKFRLLKPLAVTDAMLTSSTVPENDYAVWVSGTTYALGDRVIRTETHKIYERLIAGAGTVAPESDTTNWLEVSPTNRWKCLDNSNTTTTTQAGSIQYVFTPGVIVTSIALLNAVGTTIRIQMDDPVEGALYDETFTLQAPPQDTGWYAYFFEEIGAKTQIIKQGLPTYRSAVFTITVSAGTGNASCGVLLLGNIVEIGIDVLSGARLRITSYSRKERNDFGDFTIVKRNYSKKAEYDTLIENSRIDWLQTTLASVRDEACLWIASDTFESTTIYGFFKDFSVLISYPQHSQVSIELEGLT